MDQIWRSWLGKAPPAPISFILSSCSLCSSVGFGLLRQELDQIGMAGPSTREEVEHMRIFFAKHPMLRKSLATFAIIFMFITGRYIPLPKVELGSYINLNPFLDTAISLSGGSLSQIGLFSLGLGPMMYASLLNQLFSLGKRPSLLPPQVVAFRKNMLMLLIAMIQGLGIAVNLTYAGPEAFMIQVFQVTAVLVTGAVVIHWLANLNSAYGFGGPMAIMLTSIIFNQFANIPTVVELWQDGFQWLVIAFAFWALLTIFLIVIFDRAEYRIPIQRMSIHNKYAKDSYLPLKLNIVGGMPLMYAYSLMAFPQYVIMLLVFLFPKLSYLQGLSGYFMLDRWSGVLIYLVIIVVLSLLSAFVNVDVISMAESMRNSGDYIPYIRSGKPTQVYLSRYVRFFAWFNAIYIVLLSGIPMVLALFIPAVRPIAGLIGIFMMVGGMMLGILEEFKVMRLKKQYVSLFD